MAEKSCVKIIKDFSDHILSKGKSELTAKNYRQSLGAFDQWLIDNDGQLIALTRLDVQLYIQSLESKGNCAVTINNRFAAISQFARFIKRPDIIEDIRLPEVRQVRNIAPQSIERKERNNLLREIERKGNLRDIAIVNVFLRTGLRVSELVALNRSDLTITERSGSVKVRNGKGNVSRKIPLSAEARMYLKPIRCD